MTCESTGYDLGLQSDAPNMHPRSGAGVRREFGCVSELTPRNLRHRRALAAALPGGSAQDGLAHMPASTTSHSRTSLTTCNSAVGTTPFSRGGRRSGICHEVRGTSIQDTPASGGNSQRSWPWFKSCRTPARQPKLNRGGEARCSDPRRKPRSGAPVSVTLARAPAVRVCWPRRSCACRR